MNDLLFLYISFIYIHNNSGDIMYYIKNFLIYSLLGFIMESTLFKITNTPKYSGIFYGPITAVYGVGIVAILLINKYIFKKIKCNKYLKLSLEFIICLFVLSFIEFLGGNILNLLFDIDMWNYSNKNLNIGKYVCLQYALIWGLLGVIFLHIIRPFTDKLLNKVTIKETYIFLIIFIIDLVLVLITKL